MLLGVLESFVRGSRAQSTCREHTLLMIGCLSRVRGYRAVPCERLVYCV